jgi:PAS domain S-box-containing protein
MHIGNIGPPRRVDAAHLVNIAHIGTRMAQTCPIPGGLTGIYWRDISDRKSTEGALRDSEERSRRVFEQNPLGMATADLDGRFREVNPALCQMLGYTAEQLTRLSYLDIVHPDDREECVRQGRAAAAGATLHLQLEERFIRRSGDPVWVKINVCPIRCARGWFEDAGSRRNRLAHLSNCDFSTGDGPFWLDRR